MILFASSGLGDPGLPKARKHPDTGHVSSGTVSVAFRRRGRGQDFRCGRARTRIDGMRRYPDLTALETAGMKWISPALSRCYAGYDRLLCF
jgi:hypothetical protein